MGETQTVRARDLENGEEIKEEEGKRREIGRRGRRGKGRGGEEEKEGRRERQRQRALRDTAGLGTLVIFEQ